MKQLQKIYCLECKRYYNRYYFEKVHLNDKKHNDNIKINYFIKEKNEKEKKNDLEILNIL